MLISNVSIFQYPHLTKKVRLGDLLLNFTKPDFDIINSYLEADGQSESTGDQIGNCSRTCCLMHMRH